MKLTKILREIQIKSRPTIWNVYLEYGRYENNFFVKARTKEEALEIALDSIGKYDDLQGERLGHMGDEDLTNSEVEGPIKPSNSNLNNLRGLSREEYIEACYNDSKEREPNHPFFKPNSNVNIYCWDSGT